ncbi:MAG: branched-chain amino acid ABC transporter permease [Alphaproteobacteria bacterium]|nr:branched-chain amino acid ABC transporter permease [Rhizobiaceae bacterium]MBU3962178.1 branched-chain amino acid ABC transporter permease [Alphaproteobacteria bacterium]MBU4089868.1 branched-chain amino acid ABC transporter permease [Alphaproteobacteria bacterium]
MNSRTLLILAGVAILAVAPVFVYPMLIVKLLCFALFASAFNLMLGYTGLLSFGHAMFFGIAGYVLGLGMKHLGWPPEVGLLAGMAGAALLGLIAGAIAIRREGIYFAMITLAISQLIYFIAMQVEWTGRDDGLHGIPRGHLFGIIDLSNDFALYGLVAVCFVLALAGIRRIVTSPFGQVLTAIRENEPRAISLGYDVERYKVMAFVLSAALSGLAGGLKALALSYESLNDLHWSLSGEVVMMCILGGLGTLSGPVVGAFFVIVLQNFLADKVGEWLSVIIGLVFLFCILAMRKGFVGEFTDRLSSLRKKQRAAS